MALLNGGHTQHHRTIASRKPATSSMLLLLVRAHLLAGAWPPYLQVTVATAAFIPLETCRRIGCYAALFSVYNEDLYAKI